MVTGFDNSMIKNYRGRISLNESGIDVLKTDVLEYARRVNDILNKISGIVDETEAYFDSAIGAQYRARFHELSNSFQNITSNIENVAYGLKTAKTNFANKTEETIAQLNNAEEKISIR